VNTDLIASPRGWRLYLVLGGLFLVFTLLVLQSYRSVDAELTEAALARRSALAALGAATLSEKFERLTDVGIALATRERFREQIAAGRWEEAAQIVRRVPADFGFIERLLLTDTRGTLMADVPQLHGAKGANLANRDWYKQVSEGWKPVVSPIYKRSIGPLEKVLAVPVPVRGSDDRVLGILVLQVRLEAFFEWARTLDVGPGGFVYIVDSKGQAVFHPGIPAQGEIVDLSQDPVVRQLLRGAAGIDVGVGPVSGKQQVFAFAPVTHGWGIVAQQPADTVFASRDNQLRGVLIGYFSVLLFCVAVIYLATRLLVQHRQADADRRAKAELERQVAERTMQLDSANRFLDSVIENIPAVIFIKDADDLRFVRINRANEELVGYSRNDLLGKNGHNFFPKEEADFFASKDREVLARGVMVDIPEEPVHTRNKGVRILHTKKIPILDDDGRPRYVLGISEDVTEKKEKEREILRLNAALRQRTADADTANRAKSTFLATMSHEIRTPMNGVLGMLELLGMTKLDAEQRTTLEIVRQSGKSLLRIIDDILDFSKIEAGKLEVRPEAASIKEVIEGVRNIYSGVASSKGLLITHSVDPAISPAVLVDPLRLRQILNNFVSNALKFTDRGTVEIRADVIERAGGKERVRFSVKDTGIGISAENQQRLFQPFSQAEGDTARRFGGTGLGLTICRRLAGMMGGSIEMLSELGKGTTMILDLSLPIAEPKDLPKTDPKGTRDLLCTTTSMRRLAPSVAQAETEGTLVLLVDDHPTNRALLVRQLHALGYAAESAENGLEALDKWKSGRFGIVITDCNMPEMDGYELARGIRKLESANGGKRTPIIACTANALGGEAEICFAAGMDDYLAKPVELRDMLKKLDHWLPIPAAGAGAAAPLDRSVLAAVSGGDAAAERDILTDFRRVNDEDAAMLKQAVSNTDIAQVTRATHRIKGASKTVGAMGLASVCENIEHASRANDWTKVKAGMGAFHQEWMRLNAYLDSH